MSRSFNWRQLFGGKSDAADAAAYAFEGVADQLKAVEGNTRAIINTPPTSLRRGDTVSFTTTFTTGDQMPANPNVGDIRVNKAGHFQSWDGTRWVLHDPHRDGTAGTMGRGVRGPSPSFEEVDEIHDFEGLPRMPRLPLMDPTLSAVLKRRPCKIEVHSDDAEWLEDQLLNHRIPSAQVTPMLLDGEAGPDSADVEVTELVEPGTIRATYWTPVRNVFTLEHETEWVDVVIR